MPKRTMCGRDVGRLVPRRFMPPPPPQSGKIMPVDGGLHIQNPGTLLAPNESPRMNGPRIVGKLLMSQPSLVTVADAGDDIFLTAVDYYKRTGVAGKIMLVGTLDLYDGSTLVPPSGALGGSAFNFATMVFNDVFFFTNHGCPLRQWPGTGNHTAVPTGYAAKTLAAVSNHIILGNIIDGGVNYEHDIVWSQNFAGTVSFTGTGSGRVSLVDTAGPIYSILALSPSLGLIFKSDAILELRATGNVDAPFETPERARGFGAGLLFPRCAVQYRGLVFFPGSDEQVYVYDGSQFTPIGDKVNRDIFTLTDAESAFAAFDPVEHEYVIVVGPPGDFAVEAFAFNVDYRRWRHYSVPDGSCAMGYLHGDNTARFGFGTGGRRFSAFQLRSFDPFTDIGAFSYETADFIGPEAGTEATLMRVGVMTGDYSSWDVSVGTFAVHASTDGGRTWTAAANTPTIGRNKTVFFDFNLTGYLFRIRITANAGQAVEIVSITPWFLAMPTYRVAS